MKPRTYATPAGFKAALEQRLRNSSKSGVGLARRRQLRDCGRAHCLTTLA